MKEKIEVKDNEFLRQFEAFIHNELVKLEYSGQERKIFLTKLVMSDKLKEEGYLTMFLEPIFEMMKERNMRVVPTSPDVAKFFKANKRKYKELLPVGINI